MLADHIPSFFTNRLKIEGIILYHLAKHDKIGYDILIKKSWWFNENQAEKLRDKLNWYNPCNQAYDFCKFYPDYIAVCSEDTDHAYDHLNYAVQCTVSKFMQMGFLHLPSVYREKLP